MESRPNQPCTLGGRAAAGGATQSDVCSVQNMFIRVDRSLSGAVGTPYTLSMPGGVPLATCALPVGMFYFTLLYLSGAVSRLSEQFTVLRPVSRIVLS